MFINIANFKIFPKWEIKALEYGDYLLENNGVTMLIERKHYNDYLGSINADLKRRFMHMRNEADYTALLIEGVPPNFDVFMYYEAFGEMQKSVPFDAYTNFMTGLQKDGTWIIPTKNLRQTILAIASTYEYIGKIENRSATKAKNMLDLISLFPSIGRKKARLIMNEYPSAYAALQNLDDWLPKSVIENLKNKTWGIKNDESED